MRAPAFGRRRAGQISEAARTVAQRTPETLTVARYRAQPAAVTIARLAGTAIFAYLVALLVPLGTPRPVLAPLTALLVAQVTLYQTVRSAVRRVAAVVAGVLVAVALSAVVGFTWWSLGITIVAGLALGYLLRLGDTILEVPISAMLILSVGSTEGPAAAGRIVDTLLGAGAGLLSGLIFAAPRVESAHDAMENLCRQLADLLDQVAAGLGEGTAADSVETWLARARDLTGEIGRVDEAVSQAEESLLLSPRRLLLPVEVEQISLRDGLETLDHAAIIVRGLARSLADLARLGAENSSMSEAEERTRLAGALRELAQAVLAYGRLATVHDDEGRETAAEVLEWHLDAARHQQDRLSAVLAADPAERPIGWPLRGELISHIGRLRDELEPDGAGEPHPDRVGPWWLPGHLAGRRPQLPIRTSAADRGRGRRGRLP
ncbi:MAG TPA: aromatic acid exporter family protein [Streptosporangiaceae bacterium]|nr:aromatic acid exporter family protein [Streptosporangiaceae bacterium]